MRRETDHIERAGLVAAVEQAADSIVITDTEGRIQYVNPAFTAMTGYTSAEAVGQYPGTLQSGQHLPAFYREMWGTISSGRVWHGELINRRKNGTLYHEEMQITPVEGPNGEITNYIAIKRDVTERRAAEDAKRLLAAIVEGSEDAIHSVSLDGTILTWNRGAEVLFGYSSQEIIGKSAAMLAPPGRESEVRMYLEAVGKGLTVSSFDTVLRGKDGRGRDVSLSISPIRNPAGVVVGAAGIARDIGKRMEAERKLRESEERFREVFEHAPFGLCLTGLDGHITQVNVALCRILGYSQEELLGTAWAQRTHPEDLVSFLRWMEQWWKDPSGCVEVENRYIQSSGNLVWARVRMSLVRDRDGDPLFRWFFRDMRAEAGREELIYARKGTEAPAGRKLFSGQHESRNSHADERCPACTTAGPNKSHRGQLVPTLLSPADGHCSLLIDDILDLSRSRRGRSREAGFQPAQTVEGSSSSCSEANGKGLGSIRG